ncbi:Heterokaryon incompatibility protein 6,OR allele [Lachnellula willkommii]|uniref:Heterokaryon incompatibility protein 6,OR allele n=1 Tax=Lachnellula willkommii TaxID=215461 RepID=A0A559MGQ2_9HELO|nr:Heterokaryon incompatibility protein 6,OR allele [Lachnellula willkommii]
MSERTAKRRKVDISTTVTFSEVPTLRLNSRDTTEFSLHDQNRQGESTGTVSINLASSCYHELRDSQEIRLLHILPDPHPKDRRLQCKLVAADIHSGYKALSYTWGKQDERSLRIWVNGVLVPVGRNLMCALRALQANHTLAPILWVDALCINQDDMDERNRQVALMGRIYENASQVIAWLGTPQEFNFRPRTIPAFELVREASIIPSQTGNHLLKCPFPLEPHLKARWLLREQNKWLAAYVYNPDFSEHWKQLAGLCGVEYWQRVWIIQEFCLAKKIRLLYGSDVLDWKCFEVVWSLLRRLIRTRVFVPALTPITSRASIEFISQSRATSLRPISILNAMNPVWRPEGFTFQRLLTISQNCLSKDPRDKIYGLLGLAENVHSSDIPINYSQSVFQLYENVLAFQARQGFGHENSLWFSYRLQRSLLSPVNRARVKEIAMGRQTWTKARQQSLASIPSLRISCYYMGSIMTEDCLSREDIAAAWQKALSGLWKADKEKFSFFETDGSICGTTKSLALTSQKASSHELSIFITQGHEIGIAPKRIKGTDILCRFPGNSTPGNNFSAIVRLQENGYKIIGRALMSKTKLISTSGEHLEWPLPAFGKLAHEVYMNVFSKMKIEVDVSVPALQALTCPLTWTGTRKKDWYDDLECPVSDGLRYWRAATRFGRHVNQSREGETLEELTEAGVFLI